MREMTPARTRDAASILRVTYLPLMTGHQWEDWRERPDVSELLADVLDRQADAIEDIRARASSPAGAEEWMRLMPEYVALFALVEKLEQP